MHRSFVYFYFTYVDVLCEDVFIFYSLRKRGLCNSVERKASFLFCKNKGAHCVLLQETHSKPDGTSF